MNMTSNKKYMKYLFIVILYFSVCILCLIIKNNVFIANRLQLKNNISGKNYGLSHKSGEQFVKLNNETLTNDVKKIEYNTAERERFDVKKVSIPQSVFETCNNYYNLTTTLVKRHYLLSPKKTSLYCWIRKIASTSLTKFFSDLWNRKVSRDYYKEIDNLSAKTIEELRSLIKDHKVFKFLIVRHPFERLVSSYRDRIEDNTKHTAQAWIYTQRIFHLTRPKLFRSNAKAGSSLSRIFNNDKRLKLVPTFEEFITWLLQESPSKDDVHWDSYYSHCSVCDISYNFIMKLDNNSIEGIDFIFSAMGLDKNEYIMPKLEKTNGGLTDYERTCSYFKTLTRDMILKLYQRYKIDFEMFDYRYENYLECAD